MEKIKLFCLPYAGGSAVYYSKWKKCLCEYIEICPIELSGRGKRYEQPLYKNISEVVEDLYKIVKPQIKDEKFAFYGHSMGSLIAYELSQKIFNTDGKVPIHMFLSGGNPPNFQKKTCFHKLPDEEFMEEIVKLGSTPKEVIEKREFFDIFVPIIKADYSVLENYKYNKSNCKLDCNFTILSGKDDPFVEKDVTLWNEFTTKQCKEILFDGGHFFIHDKTAEITKFINDTLKEYFERS